MASKSVSFLTLAALFLLLSRGANAAILELERVIKLPDGRPAVGAKVLLRSFHLNDGSVWQEKRVVLGSDGVLRAKIQTEVLPKSTRNVTDVTGYLVIDSPGTALTFERFDDVPPLEWKSDLVLDGGSQIGGIVVDAAGMAVPWAQVKLAGFFFPDSSRQDAEKWRINWPAAKIATDGAVTVAGLDGSFLMRAVRIADSRHGNVTYPLRLLLLGESTRGKSATGAEVFSLSRNDDPRNRPEDNTHKVLHLYPTTTLRGRVIDALQSKPLSGAKVQLTAEKNAVVAAFYGPVKTNGRGEFQLAAPTQAPLSKDLSLQVSHADFASTYFGGENWEDKNPAGFPGTHGVLSVVLTPTVEVHGRVVEIETNEPPRSPITIYASYLKDLWGGGKVLGPAPAQVQGDGTFTLKLPIGPNNLYANGPGYTDPGTKVNQVEIKPSGNAEMRVSIHRSGGYLVHFLIDKNEDPQDLSLAIRIGGSSIQITTWREWLWLLEDTRGTTEIMVWRYGLNPHKELLPWTKLQSIQEMDNDLNYWPQSIDLEPK